MAKNMQATGRNQSRFVRPSLIPIAINLFLFHAQIAQESANQFALESLVVLGSWRAEQHPELRNDRIPQPGGSFIECGKWQMAFRAGQF